MIRSVVLFVHIAGVLALFAGLALEAFGVEAARKAAPRISGIAMAVTVVAGFYLGARFGVLRNEWLLASYGAIVVMAAAGALARRSDALVRISLRVRTAFGLAVVYLMVAKPNGLASLVVLGLAVVGSTLVSLPKGQGQRTGLSRA
jgi:hypothetical protein